MNKIILVFFVLVIQALESVAQIGDFYNDSMLRRHEFLADSLISQRAKYYELGEIIKNSILTNTLNQTEGIPYLNPGFKVFQDTKRICTNCPINIQTRYILYDNGGLDKILDSLNEIMTQVGKDYYLLKLIHNKDSILNRIEFFYYPTPTTSRKHLSYISIVSTITLEYTPNGELYSYLEKVNDTLVRQYTFNKSKKRQVESLAMDTIRIDGTLKLFEVYYFKSKLSRIYTLDPFTHENEGLSLIWPNIFGQYNNIILREGNKLLYEAYNGPFRSGYIYRQSDLDESVYYYYFFNYFGRVTNFNVLKKYSDFNQFNTFYLRNGKIKKFEEKTILHDKSTND